ncbi:MAG: PfkB family carbohydrate kinase [Dokdonella sp.]
MHALARKWRVPTLVITLAAQGCLVSHAQDERRGDNVAFYRVSAERVTTIDTTSAGDAAL